MVSPLSLPAPSYSDPIVEICHLVYTPNALRPPTPQEIAAHTAERLTQVKEMQVAAVEAAEEKKRAFQSKREGGKGKREERRKAEQELKEDKEDKEAELFAPPPTSTANTVPATNPSAAQAYFSAVPAHLTTHPWFQPTTSSFTTLSSAREAGIWTYPSTPLERARCATYRKVWAEGMFMGQGVKFGGEFLVYPGTSLFATHHSFLTDASAAGDPLRYHSHFVTTTLPTPQTPIRPLELVAWGRLGTATKKAHLVCCVDLEEGERGEVDCYSLEWANFG